MKPNTLKHALTFGLILGGLFSLNFFIMTSQSVFLSFFWLAVVALIPYLMYRFMVVYRKSECNDRASFGRMFTYALLLLLSATLISFVFKFAYLKFFNPSFIQFMKESTLQFLDSANMLSGEITPAYVRSLLTPMNVSFGYTFYNVFFGVPMALILAGITKKQADNPFEDADHTDSNTNSLS